MTRNAKVALICGAFFFGMVGASFAAVPLYRAFCQATGFAGTAKRAKEAASERLAQTVTVRFDTNVQDLPWDFKAEQASQTLQLGQTGLAFFKEVTNRGSTPLVGRALFGNVAPDQAGPYFSPKLRVLLLAEPDHPGGGNQGVSCRLFRRPALRQGRRHPEPEGDHPLLHLLPGRRPPRPVG